MHYFDGTEVKVGDTFEKDPVAPAEHYDGGLKEGERAIALHLNPGSDTCNVQGAALRLWRPGEPANYGGMHGLVSPDGQAVAVVHPFTGTTRAFRLVRRAA